MPSNNTIVIENDNEVESPIGKPLSTHSITMKYTDKANVCENEQRRVNVEQEC